MTITRFAPFSNFAVIPNDRFVPAVDIYEDTQKLVLKLEVPGVKQEDLDISLEKNVLTVKGERKFESEQKEENFRRIERRYGSFERSFSLPQIADGEQVTADAKDGILTIEIAKKAEAQPKKITIGSALKPAA